MPITNSNKIIFVIFLSLFFVSCSKKDTRPPEERSVARWEAIINDNWEEAYMFQTPNYRETYDSTTYRNSFGDALDWISVKFISSKKVSEKITDIKLNITSTFSEAAGLPIPSILTERWILIDGTWWFTKQ